MYKFLLIGILGATAMATQAADRFHVGQIDADNIINTMPQFNQHKDDVQFSKQQLEPLQQYTKPLTIEVYFGQWCHDSQREVPRLIRLFSSINNPNITVTYWGLDTNKSDTTGRAKAINIKRTPTLVVFQKGVELGRILEVPTVDWATDLTAIVVQ